MLIKVTCPNCGATLDMDSASEQMFCSRCGVKILNSSQQAPAPQMQSPYQNVQLVVRFRANRYDLPLLVRVDGGTLLRVANGAEQAFALSVGRHEIRVKVGNRNYARVIFVSSPADTVLMEVDWFGKAQIRMSDLSSGAVYQAPVAASPVYPAVPQETRPAARSRKL